MTITNSGPAIISSPNQAPGLSATWSDPSGTALVKPDGSLVTLNVAVLAGNTGAANSALIATAAAAVDALGGGVVKIPPVTFSISEAFPVYNNIVYEGTTPAGTAFAESSITPSGTVVLGDGTFNFFTFFGTVGSSTSTTLGDLGAAMASQALFLQAQGKGFGVRDMVIGGPTPATSFVWGIKVGAKWNPGVTEGIFENLFIRNCVYWGFWDENSIGGTRRNIQVAKCGSRSLTATPNKALISALPGGHFMLCGSGGGNTIWNSGNMIVEDIKIQGNSVTPYHARNLCVNARGASNINEICVYGATAITTSNTVSKAISSVNGQAYITVGTTTPGAGTQADAQLFAVGLPVSFASANTDFKAKETYYVQAIEPGGVTGTIALAYYKDGPAIVCTGNNNVGNLVSGGFEHIELIGLDTSIVQPGELTGLDLEGTATTAITCQQAFGQYVTTTLAPNDGTLSGGTATSGAITTLTIRDGLSGNGTKRNIFNFPNGSICDLGRTSLTDSNIVTGPRFTFGSFITGGNARLGTGVQPLYATLDNPSLYATPSTYGAALYLRGINQPDAYVVGSNGAFMLNGPGLQTKQLGLSGDNTDIINGSPSFGQYGDFVHTNGANNTWTLRALAATDPGLLVWISNPQNFTITLATSSSQHIIGLGLDNTGAVLTVAAYSAALLKACSNGGTLYWQRLL